MIELVVEPDLAGVAVAGREHAVGDGARDDHPLHSLATQPRQVALGIGRASRPRQLEP